MLNCKQNGIRFCFEEEETINLWEEDVHDGANPKLVSQASNRFREASIDVVIPPVGHVCLEHPVHHHSLRDTCHTLKQGRSYTFLHFYCHAQEYQGFYQQNVSILIDLNVTGGHM